MIVGYDIACYSNGSGPCVAPTAGYLRVDTFDAQRQQDAMKDLLRKQLLLHPSYPRVTSIIVDFVWEDDRRVQVRAGLIDRTIPERAPYPHQEREMAAFLSNVWVGEEPPPRPGTIS